MCPGLVLGKEEKIEETKGRGASRTVGTELIAALSTDPLTSPVLAGAANS